MTRNVPNSGGGTKKDENRIQNGHPNKLSMPTRSAIQATSSGSKARDVRIIEHSRWPPNRRGNRRKTTTKTEIISRMSQHLVALSIPSLKAILQI